MEFYRPISIQDIDFFNQWFKALIDQFDENSIKDINQCWTYIFNRATDAAYENVSSDNTDHEDISYPCSTSTSFQAYVPPYEDVLSQSDSAEDNIQNDNSDNADVSEYEDFVKDFIKSSDSCSTYISFQVYDTVYEEVPYQLDDNSRENADIKGFNMTIHSSSSTACSIYTSPQIYDTACDAVLSQVDSAENDSQKYFENDDDDSYFEDHDYDSYYDHG